MKQKLKAKIEMLGITAAPESLDKLELFYRLLIEANETFNLTNITTEDEVIDKHFIDSLAGAPYLTGGAAVDVGSGAGFPGIPLAVFCPGVRFTLLDSLQKRVGFLQDAITRLQLPNAVATHMRAEDAGKGLLRESQNFALARAVAPLNTLCEYCLPLIQVGGAFLAYKTFSPEETENAQNALKLLGGKLREVKTYTLPGTDISRALVVVDKTAPTPPKYPRGKNKERTEPL
jgi:16S rRNA (guanine527-N7)-methyltransferase